MSVVRTHRPAPGALELVRRFVNTLDVEGATDDIATPSDLAAWLGRSGLAPRSVRPSAADVDRVVDLREALRRLLLANNAGEAGSPRAFAELNRQAREAQVELSFGKAGSALVARGGGVDAAVARLLAIVHQAMEEGTWPRLKVCPADDCLWAFYDHSRNRSGTWCWMGECGNRAKARTYRERHRAEGPR